MYLELDVPKDPEGNSCVMEHPLFEHEFLAKFLANIKNKIFDYLKTLSDDIVEDSKNDDKDFMENSMLYLDDKLRDHKPKKGKLEVDVK